MFTVQSGAWDRTARCQHVCRVAAACGLLGVILVPRTAIGQDRTAPTTASSPSNQEDPTARFELPTVTVTAPKVPENVQDVPASVTAVPNQTLEDDGVRYVSDAAIYAPNTHLTDWSARKLSDARVRGIGSSPNNPGITTYIDGVPQLNENSASLELLDVDQIEFVRGPQSALYGRNTLGGLINITSVRPSRTNWTGSVTGLPGDYHLGDVRGTASGPLMGDTLALGVGFGYSGRDGYTVNDVTGHDLDSRSALFGKTQLLWNPNATWQARVLLTGERARDGDYALVDLATLRANPFHASRNYEGFTNRDIVAPTVLVSRTGGSVDFSSVTGVVWWNTEDSTDLDYSALPLITRDNKEHDLQFTQEFRFASAKNRSISLAGPLSLAWQAGVFVFTQDYTQDAVNNFAPQVLSPALAFPVSQTSPQSALDDRGVGVYGQATLTFWHRLDGIVGIRGDSEHKAADLSVFYQPAIAPSTAVNAAKDFSDVSPQFTVAYRIVPGKSIYATAVRGFKAGGFNSASPTGDEAYGEEHSWNYEAGVKTSWFADRMSLDAAAFFIDWSDMQVNVPNPAVPAQFYIASVGGARSKGVELELHARALPRLDLFGNVGYTDAHFDSGAQSGGVNVGGNTLSSTPDYTASVGAQSSVGIGAATLYGRVELAMTGAFEYDDANTVGQSAYTLANFRAGVRGKRAFAEIWVRNAFDTHYVPIAFAYPGLAPSGFVGEPGAPRTFGARLGWKF
jgi:iron complex outermembrane receptor protein